jgi:hypothetical protein
VRGAKNKTTPHAHVQNHLKLPSHLGFVLRAWLVLLLLLHCRSSSWSFLLPLPLLPSSSSLHAPAHLRSGKNGGL